GSLRRRWPCGQSSDGSGHRDSTCGTTNTPPRCSPAAPIHWAPTARTLAARRSLLEPADPLLRVVLGGDHAHCPGGGAHDDGLGEDAVVLVAHAPQQVPVGDAGGGEVAVVRGDEIVRGQHPVEVVTGVERLLVL